MHTLLLIISMSLMYSAPLAITSLGGVLTQRSGVDNIGLEGMMTFGAFCGAVAAYFTESPWLGLLAAGLGGALLALFHAIAAISLNGSQIISGIAINFIGSGISIFLTRFLFDGATQSHTVLYKLPRLSSLLGADRGSGFWQSFDVDFTVFLAAALTFLLWFVLYRTKIGLRIRACGEHPAAADSLGCNVRGIRYACVLLSGVLSGFGGAAMTLAIVSNFAPAVISGQGYIALAAVIFGNWKPLGAALACLLFGFAQAMVIMLSNVQAIPSQILAMFPYALTLLVLVFFSKRNEAPRAIGKPYYKGSR